MNRVLDLFKMTDEEFLEKYLGDATVEELADFMKEFPEFLNDDQKAEYGNDMRNKTLEIDEMLLKIKERTGILDS